MDYTVHGILQARILEWVAFPFSRDLPNPGVELRSPTLQADSLPAEPQGKPEVEDIYKERWQEMIRDLQVRSDLGSLTNSAEEAGTYPIENREMLPWLETGDHTWLSADADGGSRGWTEGKGREPSWVRGSQVSVRCPQRNHLLIKNADS